MDSMKITKDKKVYLRKRIQKQENYYLKDDFGSRTGDL